MKRILSNVKPSHMVLLLGAAVVLGIAVVTSGSLWFQHDRELVDAQRSIDGLSRALAIQTERAIKSADLTLVGFLRRKRAAELDGYSPTPSAAEFGAANPTIVSLAYVTVSGSGSGDVTAEAAARRAFAEPGADPVLVPRDDGLVSVVRRLRDDDGTIQGAAVAVIDPAWLVDFNRAMNFSGEGVVTLTDDYGVVVARSGTNDGSERLISTATVGEYALSANVSLPKFVLLRGWQREFILFIAVAGAASIAFGFLAVQFARQWAQREAAEGAVRTSEGRFRDFAEAASDWLWETDAEHRFHYISDRFSDLTGIDKEHFIGKNRSESAANGADPELMRKHLADFEAHRPFRDFVYPIVAGDGNIRHLRVSGQPMFDSDGRFVGYRGTASDVTKVVQDDARLREAKNEAELASRSKTEFLANMSHELRTPLNAVIGFSEIIRDQLFGKIPSRYVEYARDIHMSGSHLLDLINDVLDMSKIEAGRYELYEEPVNLGEIVHTCITLMATRIEEGHVQVRCAEELTDTVLLADKRAIKQTVLNLLSNAVKFTPSGGMVLVGIETQSDGGVTLVVSDTGIGIDAAALPHVAEPFYQADSSIGRTYGGSGLGLTISRKLILQHGGSLKIESRVPGGTTVRVIIPAPRVLAVSATPSTAPDQPTHALPRSSAA
ncbi:MAG TPA: ATP-binding protein [Stellaceae bacterium]|nr:ATP-binding protein [Stellaceae bacterium]